MKLTEGSKETLQWIVDFSEQDTDSQKVVLDVIKWLLESFNENEPEHKQETGLNWESLSDWSDKIDFFRFKVGPYNYVVSPKDVEVVLKHRLDDPPQQPGWESRPERKKDSGPWWDGDWKTLEASVRVLVRDEITQYRAGPSGELLKRII